MYGNGIHDGIPNAAYHADDALSMSAAKLLLPPSCPALFRWVRDNGQKPKRVWDFGSLAHTLVLGEGEDIIVLDPAVHGLKKDGTPADNPRSTDMWRQAESAARKAGKLPVHIDDYTKARAMADKVLAHPVAGPLFTGGGQAEQSIWWTDETTGVQLRCRPDWIPAGGGVLVDYKTSVTANPAVLQRKWHDLAYRMQDAWYRSGYAAVTGEPCRDFVFVAQEKAPPYLVSVLRFDADAVADGARMMRRAVTLFADCTDSGQWPGYTDTAVALSLPAWVQRDAINDEAAQLITELEDLYR